MKSRLWKTVAVSILVLLVAAGGPLEALCWGSLYIASTRTRTQRSCPQPSVTRTWRLHCYDGCGYSEGLQIESISGYGECFKGANCTRGVRCYPSLGIEIIGFNPPSLSAAAVDVEGFYAGGPCQVPSCRTAGITTLNVVCRCDPDADPTFCAQNDPIIVSLEDSRYQLTDRGGGVVFDLGNAGVPTQVPWTDRQSDEAFLVLDRNGNGAIDDGTELFGDVTPQHESDSPNGFRALAVFDDTLSGGDEDGRISAADAIYAELGLWRDADHDGISDPSEIVDLAAAGLEWIGLDYRRSSRVDRHGNEFRYRSRSGWSGGETRSVWNVFLVAE